ncbi:hypothetical protein [Flavobacterium ustbae]|uniref:hypothetical protein n=1 Tax=Flavobacterium ustbae TaxID=2488790 RepID=UPI000F78CB1D|nr:hypothetical protein [Flavobacterium ustbae]
MRKITHDDIENEYKEAIREKYRVEKNNGKHSHYLTNPSQALLRDLCWEIFNSQPKVDDLAVYRTFFKAEFIPKEEDASQKYTDKFKKVGAFLKAERGTAKISTVELAAILVDFEPRPFRKFVKKEFESDQPKKENVFTGNVIDSINETNFSTVTLDFEKEPESSKAEILPVPLKSKSINLFLNVKEKILHRFKEKLKMTVIAVALIFGLITAVVYFAFFKKHCMQWTGDHYEVVDCTSNNEKNLNVVIPLDNDLLDFKKINACDTTKCFLNNGEAIIWYCKTANGIDFFNDNGNGRHPENKKALRPMTNYMFSRYLKGKPCE